MGQLTAKLEKLTQDSWRGADTIIGIVERRGKRGEKIVERRVAIDGITAHLEARPASGMAGQRKATKQPDPFEGLVEESLLVELEADKKEYMDGVGGRA